LLVFADHFDGKAYALACHKQVAYGPGLNLVVVGIVVSFTDHDQIGADEISRQLLRAKEGTVAGPPNLAHQRVTNPFRCLPGWWWIGLFDGRGLNASC
jgi:hypothetical protein